MSELHFCISEVRWVIVLCYVAVAVVVGGVSGVKQDRKKKRKNSNCIRQTADLCLSNFFSSSKQLITVLHHCCHFEKSIALFLFISLL